MSTDFAWGVAAGAAIEAAWATLVIYAVLRRPRFRKRPWR